MSQCQQVCNKFTLSGHFIRFTCWHCDINSMLAQIANQPITWLQYNVLWHVDLVKTTCLKFKPSIRMRKKGDISDSECSRVVGARQAGLKIQKMRIYWDFVTHSLGFKENGQKKRKYPLSSSYVDRNVDVRGQRRMGRLVWDDRKAIVTQITTQYNQEMQNSISKHTSRQALKKMGNSCRRPHPLPLLSAKNRKLRLQFIQAYQNGRVDD